MTEKPPRITSGPALIKQADLMALLTNLETGDVLFIDEIHRLPTAVEEFLFPAMEDFRVDFTIEGGLSGRVVNFALRRFTLIGATTRAGMLSGALRDRFGHRFHLEFYPTSDLTTILHRSAGRLEVPVENGALETIAGRSRGTPRVANRLLKRVRDYAQVRADGVLTRKVVADALEIQQIDALGLDELDRHFLAALIKIYRGGPAGIEALAATMGVERDTLEDMVEPYLLQIGFVIRTRQGRCATRDAYTHLGLPFEETEATPAAGGAHAVLMPGVRRGRADLLNMPMNDTPLTRREIVERAITFRRPPRLPMKFDVVGVNDCYDVWTVDPTGWTWDFGTSAVDEWGCRWERTAVDNTGLVTGHPLQTCSAPADFAWPDPDHPRRYAGFEQQLAGADDRFVMFCFGHGLFERLHLLLGMTETLIALKRRPDLVHAVLERILDHHLRVFHNCLDIAGGRLHAAALADDWGLQDQALISVPLFGTFFKPLYARWFAEIKAAGLHPWLHSCGHVNELIGEFIDCGLEVINLQQPNVVGIDAIAERYRGRICFESIVDTQSTLPRGTHDEIRTQARELVEKWGTPEGGFIASDYNDAAAIGVTRDRRLVMFEAFAQAGRYPDYERVLAGAPPAPVGHSYGRAQRS